jgi:hypothetical protein
LGKVLGSGVDVEHEPLGTGAGPPHIEVEMRAD